MTQTIFLSVLVIVAIHWIADFIYQAEAWATNKSKSNSALLKHTVTYSLITTFLWALAFPTSYDFPNILKIHDGYQNLVYVFLITFCLHTITDYFTSRVVSHKFANKEYGTPIPNSGAFTVIGFDQVLHYLQLFGTYYLFFAK